MNGASEHRYLVDAHVHYHACYEATRFLDAAAGNFERAARRRRLGGAWTGCLLLADQQGQDTVRQWHADAASLRRGGWQFLATEEGAAWLAMRDDGARLVVVAGRQIVSAERLELLALGCTEAIADGQPLAKVAREVRTRGALCVVPWGFGKWWFRRRNVLSEFLRGLAGEGDEHGVFLGDNGGRPQWSRPVELGRLAGRFGLRILPGSDPLPLASHARRAGGRGCVVPGTLDAARPWARVVAALGAGGQPEGYGRGASLLAFARDQVAMQWRKRRIGSLASEGNRP